MLFLPSQIISGFAEIKVGPVPTVGGLVIVGGPPQILVTTGVLAMDDLDTEPTYSRRRGCDSETEPDRNPGGLMASLKLTASSRWEVTSQWSTRSPARETAFVLLGNVLARLTSSSV